MYPYDETRLIIHVLCVVNYYKHAGVYTTVNCCDIVIDLFPNTVKLFYSFTTISVASVRHSLQVKIAAESIKVLRLFSNSLCKLGQTEFTNFLYGKSVIFFLRICWYSLCELWQIDHSNVRKWLYSPCELGQIIHSNVRKWSYSTCELGQIIH